MWVWEKQIYKTYKINGLITHKYDYTLTRKAIKYSDTLRRVRATIVAVEEQEVLHKLIVCL